MNPFTLAGFQDELQKIARTVGDLPAKFLSMGTEDRVKALADSWEDRQSASPKERKKYITQRDAITNRLRKTAAPNESVSESGMSRNGALRIEDEKNNPDWRQKGNASGLQKQRPQSETPASKANAFFGLPLGQPRKRNTKEYDQGSTAAQSPDRSQNPIDAQSTANISQGGAQYPATGPGGV